MSSIACPKNMDTCPNLVCNYPFCKGSVHVYKDHPKPPTDGSSGVKPPPTDDLTRAQIAELRSRERLWTLLGNLSVILTPALLELAEKIREDLKKPD